MESKINLFALTLALSAWVVFTYFFVKDYVEEESDRVEKFCEKLTPSPVSSSYTECLKELNW